MASSASGRGAAGSGPLGPAVDGTSTYETSGSATPVNNVSQIGNEAIHGSDITGPKDGA